MKIPFFKNKKKQAERSTDASWQALSDQTGFGVLPAYQGRQALGVTGINSAVTIIANLLSALEPAIYKRTDSGKERLPSHPLMPTLHNPTGDGRVSWASLVTLCVTDYLIYGNSILVIERKDGRETITPVPWANTSLQASTEYDAVYYDITPPYYAGSPNTKTKRVSSDNVFHWYDAVGSQDGGYTGRSAIRRCSDAVNLSAQLDTTVGSYFRRAITASGVFTFKSSLEDDTRKQFREEVKQAYEGGSKAGNFLVLDNETKFDPVGTSNKDAELLAQRQYQLAEVSRLFSIPVFFLNSDSEGTTFASSLEARTALATQVIIPMARAFSAGFSLKFLGENELLVLDTSILTKETNSKDRAIGLKTLIDAEIITPADARSMLGIESELDRTTDVTH